MDFHAVMTAFGLTLFAGLSTGFGSMLILFTKKTNVKLLSVSLGLSAGVMIYVSFMEILQSANTTLAAELGKFQGGWVAILSFFSGIVLSAVIDRFVPQPANPHEVRTVEKACDGIMLAEKSAALAAITDGKDRSQAQLAEKEAQKTRNLLRLGYLTAVVITIHNVPEGLATFITALKDLRLGVTIAIAIAVHNIPEGISVSVPIYCATGSRRKAFIYSFLSGLTELVGALIGFFILMPFLNNVLFGVIFALVAGIMVFIALDELLPAAREYGEHHLAIYGLVLGMLIMAISLVFM